VQWIVLILGISFRLNSCCFACSMNITSQVRMRERPQWLDFMDAIPAAQRSLKHPIRARILSPKSNHHSQDTSTNNHSAPPLLHNININCLYTSGAVRGTDLRFHPTHPSPNNAIRLLNPNIRLAPPPNPPIHPHHPTSGSCPFTSILTRNPNFSRYTQSGRTIPTTKTHSPRLSSNAPPPRFHRRRITRRTRPRSSIQHRRARILRKGTALLTHAELTFRGCEGDEEERSGCGRGRAGEEELY